MAVGALCTNGEGKWEVRHGGKAATEKQWQSCRQMRVGKAPRWANAVAEGNTQTRKGARQKRRKTKAFVRAQHKRNGEKEGRPRRNKKKIGTTRGGNTLQHKSMPCNRVLAKIKREKKKGYDREEQAKNGGRKEEGETKPRKSWKKFLTAEKAPQPLKKLLSPMK